MDAGLHDVVTGDVRAGWAHVATVPVPGAARGRWCILTAAREAAAAERWPLVTFEDAAAGSVGSPSFLGQTWWMGTRYRTVAYVPGSAARCRLFSRGLTPPGAAAGLSFRPVPRWFSAVLILLLSARSLPAILRFVLAGQVRRVRTALVLLAVSIHHPDDYQDWLRSFDSWPAAPPAAALGGPSIAALVFQHDTGATAALDATLASLAAQAVPAPVAVLCGSESATWRAAAAALPGEYVALLQAGEVLPPHATWFVASELQRLGRPTLAYGDEDRIGADGLRRSPVFRPAPSRLLMLSATQARGAWFVRRDVLLDQGGQDDPGWAECLRLALWLRLYEAGLDGGCRLPLILTHRRDDAGAAPAASLAAVVDGHLERTAMPLRSRPGYPVLVQASGTVRDRVSILVPSTLRTPLVLRCILSVLQDLRDRDVELVVGVRQDGPLDAVQAAAAAQIEAFPAARVVPLPFPSFNFSQVCNALAAMTSGPLILLLNDDVSVTAPGWLDEMAAVLGDPRTGIVGARLLYPDGSVQHGGVLMGLSGLCDHAHRGLVARDMAQATGYAGRAGLVQELSAVTAACLLVRRSVYEALGGLDEGYPSAFNDVDFCLRAGEAGHQVAYAPAATLVHHEMQTYGGHYRGDRAAFQAAETARMQRRWAALVENDPFHNPNLELAPGREWDLSFPPRRPRGFQVVPE